MELKNGYSLPDFSGQFSGYEGHKDKSSDVSIVPMDGILQKNKRRSTKKSIYELMSLAAWNKLLDSHTDETIGISSPIPYGIDQEGKIFMEFLQGASADHLLSNNYDNHGESVSKKQIRKDFSFRLGKIFRIKDIEGLMHGDFQLRHLIYSVNNRSLGVIDVENSRINPRAVQDEHNYVISQINDIFSQSPRFKKFISDSIEDGYYDKIDEAPRLGDIANDLEHQLGFHSKQIAKFLSA